MTAISHLYVTHLGRPREGILKRVQDSVNSRMGIPCLILPPMENPRYAYDERRSQYECRALLERLKASYPGDGLGVLGVTQVDLFVPVLKYVFGLSELGGRAAVISTHRLRPEFYGEGDNPGLLLDRLEKTAVHEVGHLLGLVHCRDPHCVMHASTLVEHTDSKLASLCPTCLELLKWELKGRSVRTFCSKMSKNSTAG